MIQFRRPVLRVGESCTCLTPMVEASNVDALGEDGRRLGCFSVVPDAEGLVCVIEASLTVWKETIDPVVSRS